MTFLTRTVVTVPPVNTNDEPLNMELALDDPGKIIITFGDDFGNPTKYELKNIYDALEYLQNDVKKQIRDVYKKFGGPLDD